jgi:hypothetical protein
MTHLDPIVAKEMRGYFKGLYHTGVVAMGKKVPVDKGTLRASLWIGRRATASYVDKNGKGFGIGSRLPYAPIQDSVARWHRAGVLAKTKFWPNDYAALRDWVYRKLKPANLDAATYYVASKLFLRGYPSHNFIAAGERAVAAEQTKGGPRMLKNIMKSVSR